MINKNLMFSSKDEEWDTPDWLINHMKNGGFDFGLDVCASRPNVCANFINKDSDALNKVWSGMCWMNPPYGRSIDRWIKHAYHAGFDQHGTTVVCLLPARTDTRYWHDYVCHAHQIVFIKGRLKFGSDKFWVDKWNKSALGIASEKSARAFMSNLGGSLAEKPELIRSFIRGDDYDKWIVTNHVKKNAAPFPSALAVFGHLTLEQANCLGELGWSVDQGW